jgi:RHS repeat-associated protein
MPDTEYLWVGDNILAEYEGGARTVQYTYDPQPYGNLLSENRNDEFRQYHYDGIGSTIALSDEQGNVTNTCEYTAFGEVAPGSQPLPTPFQYCGRVGYYFDHNLFSFDIRRRQYKVGRFNALDIYDVYVFPNRYTYVLNSPLNAFDPSGELTIWQAVNVYCNERYPDPDTTYTVARCADDLVGTQTAFDAWYVREKADLSWLAKLPDCPCCIRKGDNWIRARCNLDGILGLTFSDPRDISGSQWHPEAHWEIRSRRTNKFGAAQQCTFDENGNLINRGSSAGTPDRSPSYTFPYLYAAVDYLAVSGHYGHDVHPYNLALELDGGEPGINVDHYLEVRPPNRGSSATQAKCPINPEVELKTTTFPQPNRHVGSVPIPL